MKDEAVLETRRDLGVSSLAGATQSQPNRRAELASSVPVESIGSGNDEQFLNKLTEKLAMHIREEVKKEMLGCVSGPRARDIVTEKMDSYLQVRCGGHCDVAFVTIYG